MDSMPSSTGNVLRDFVLAPLQQALNTLWSYAPSMLGALLILLVGGIIAKILEQVIVRILKTIALDKVADQIQLSAILSKGGIRRRLSELLGAIVYWIVILAFVMAALDALNLRIAAQLFQSVVEFLPNVIAAVFILIIGVFAAAFLATMIRTAASNAGILQAHLLGQFVQIIVVVFSIVTALEQLKVQFIGEVFLILLGGLSLGFALAFGLGCKDLAGRWAEDLIQEIRSHKPR